MQDDFLRYFEEELSYIKQLIDEFCKANPMASAQFNIGAHDADPAITHLIQSFAFLTARINRRLDDDFPEISHTLMNILYPHLLKPIPSMAILKVEAETLHHSHTLPAFTLISTTLKNDTVIHFKTIYPVHLHPLKVEQISYQDHKSSKIAEKSCFYAKSTLRLTLSTEATAINLANLLNTPLRFYINMDLGKAFSLYKLIMNHTLHLEISDPQHKEMVQKIVVVENPNCLKAVGFNVDEDMLPYSPQSFTGFRLLTEYFNFPEKFLFFDIDFAPSIILNTAQQIEITFVFDDYDDTLIRYINRDSLLLSCTPVINLFKCNTRPIALSREKNEYLLIPDISSAMKDIEIYSIDQVIAKTNKNNIIKIKPLYQHYHEMASIYWHLSQKKSLGLLESKNNIYEPSINFIFLDSIFENDPVMNAHIDITCCNRNLNTHLITEQLPFSLWQHADENISSLRIISRVTAFQKPTERNYQNWKFISHLSLNHLFLSNHEHSLETLKSILYLYISNTSNNNNQHHVTLIESITDIKSKSITIRHPTDLRSGLCHGIEVTLEFNDDLVKIADFYVFASILARFFSLYCSIQTFIQLIIASKNHGEIARWKPMLGTKPLI